MKIADRTHKIEKNKTKTKHKHAATKCDSSSGFFSCGYFKV